MGLVILFIALGIGIALGQFFLGRRMLRTRRSPLIYGLYLLQRLALDALLLFAAWRVSDAALLGGAIALASGQVIFAAVLMYLSSKGE
ncbi:MAG: hypothetical protein PHD32_10285 [Eubacteriales bacterium]|nr:hypothetical protein [Eubacteriales bacterium]